MERVMCCGRSKKGGTRGGKSGRITRTKKTIKAQNYEQRTENRERLLLPSDNRLPDETRTMGPPPVPGQELLP